MEIDSEGFDQGIPSPEEMTAQQLVLLTHEAEDAWRQVGKARADISKLVAINEELNEQIMALQRQVFELRHHLSMECNRNRRMFSTWGGASSALLKSKSEVVYPIL